MSDNDHISDASSVDAEANHPGVWRALSFVLVFAAAVVLIVWTLQSRTASNLAVQNSRTLDADATMVVVEGLELPSNPSVTVLGIDGRLRTPLPTEGVELDIPSRVTSLVALYDGSDNIHGLAVVPPGGDRDAVSISPTSTARALMTLAPSVLKPDLVRTGQSLELIEADPAFTVLSDAVAASTNLSASNPTVEAAVAAILDRVQRRAVPDQGCDSVLNPRALAITGTCVEPSTSGATVSNEQDRWALAFGSPEPWSTVCAAIAPAGTPGSQQSLETAECGGQALLAAPGPLTRTSSTDAAVTNRVQVAAGVELYSSYTAPFLDLVGGSAGLNRRDNTHVFGSLDELVATTSALIGQDPGFDSALLLLVEAATPIERHAATLGATRSLAGAAGAIVPDWDAGASSHEALLDFYDRVGEQMLVVDRAEYRWTADASGIIAIGEPE